MNIRTALRNISVGTLLVGAVGILGPAVEAKHRDPDPRVRVVIRPSVLVPTTISFRHPGPFGQFAAGRVYYRPHRHYHATYNLPVVVNHRVVYRPYNYCRGRLFVRPGSPLPHLAFNVVFGDHYDYERYFAQERDRYYEDDQTERYYDGDRYYDDGPGPG
jgi:hypothetical protein